MLGLQGIKLCNFLEISYPWNLGKLLSVKYLLASLEKKVTCRIGRYEHNYLFINELILNFAKTYHIISFY